MDALFVTISQILLAFAIPYSAVTVLLGIREARRASGSLRGQEARTGTAHDLTTPVDYSTYVLIPSLNEEAVIACTVTQLLRDPACRVVVINDDSDDATVEEATRAAVAQGGTDRLHIVARRRPNARLGKGPALNAGLRWVVASVRQRGLDPSRVVVGVMDADGRLSAGSTPAALAPFEDPRVGAVQLTVRIRNRRRLIAQFQDVEFWVISAISQFARSLSGSVSLGGNGQFTRLTALMSLDGDPWSDSLTEDLDLGIRLIATGWRITTSHSAYVDQQGVEHYPQLIRQRTRWYQGHMSCLARLPELWRSDIKQVTLIEVTAYLLVPWLIVLPWSVLQPWILFNLLFGSDPGVFAHDLGGLPWQVAYGVLWYLLAFLPNLIIGLTYARRTQAVSLGRALVLGHLLILWNVVGYLAAWKALIRMLRGRTGWSKTSRTTEAPEAVSRSGSSRPEQCLPCTSRAVLASHEAGKGLVQQVAMRPKPVAQLERGS